MATQASKPIPFPTERREFVRVQDAVGLEIVSVEEEGENAEPADSVTSANPRVVNKYDIDGYADVKSDYPDVAAYIDKLEERIRHLQLGDGGVPALPTHRVSLSVSGIAFADKRPLHPGRVIQLKLTLFPSGHVLDVAGTVVSVGVESELASGDLHTYRVAFNNLARENADIINEHVRVLRRGMRQLAH